MKQDRDRLTHDHLAMDQKIKEDESKLKLNKQLPYLVSDIVEVLDVDPNDSDEDGDDLDEHSQKKGKCVVVKTSTRQVCFFPVF